MLAKPRVRGTSEKRSPLWIFEELATFRNHLLQRTGRLTQPKHTLTLTMSFNTTVQKDLMHFLVALKKAA